MAGARTAFTPAAFAGQTRRAAAALLASAERAVSRRFGADARPGNGGRRRAAVRALAARPGTRVVALPGRFQGCGSARGRGGRTLSTGGEPAAGRFPGACEPG